MKTEMHLCQNVRGNPAAAFDVDVSNDAIGGLGSPLGSLLMLLAWGPKIRLHGHCLLARPAK